MDILFKVECQSYCFLWILYVLKVQEKKQECQHAKLMRGR